MAWKETTGAATGDELEKSELWADFSGMESLKDTSPVMLYFYLPDEETENADILNMIRNCRLMEENVFAHEAVRKVSVNFHCFKCDFKELSDTLKKKYGVKIVPKAIFFDVRGKKVNQLTNSKADPEDLAKKMNSIVAECKKMLNNAKGK